MADTNVHFYNGTFMIFATHDFSVNNTGFLMKDWWVWSSPDLVDWTLESTVSPKVSLKWDTADNECWATDAAFVNGKLFFYVSAGGGQVAVMVADSIKGPWSDPLGKPLMSPALGAAQHPPTTFRDPCVFNEPGTDDYYIIAGVFEYYVTKLGADMVSLAEAPRHVNFTNHVYGPCGDGKTDDKPFMHKKSDTYYLSWGCFYATGKSVYGPFTMQGSVIDTAKIAPDFQCDGQPHQCGLAAAMNKKATAPQRARAEALAQYNQPATPIPREGESIMLVKCSDASVAATGWTQRHGAAHWGPGEPFQISLTANQSLCIEAHAPMHQGGSGEHLTLQWCDEHAGASSISSSGRLEAAAIGKLQLFSRNITTNGDDITGPVAGPQHCPCWNVNVNNPVHPAEPNSAIPYVQCETCVDGPRFNTNQRFTFPQAGGAGQIQAWKGFAPGYCVAATPAPSKPWFLHQDYTDRHGSFLSHRGQWYFFSNDESHSGDVGHEGAFRDTVGCYIHFRANGTMESCVVNAQGVNSHNLTLGPIEAENFFSLEGGDKVDLVHAGGGDGFAVGGRDGAMLRYPHVSGLGVGSTELKLRATSIGGATVKVFAHTIADTGLLAECVVPSSGGLIVYTEVACAWNAAAADVTEEVDLLLVIKSEAAEREVARVDRIWI